MVLRKVLLIQAFAYLIFLLLLIGLFQVYTTSFNPIEISKCQTVLFQAYKQTNKKWLQPVWLTSVEDI